MRIVFLGTPESALPSLRRLVDDRHEIVAVWTQPDKPAGRGKKLHESPIKQFALAHKLNVQQPARIKTPEVKELFASHHADAAIVVAYGKILPAEFLAAPKWGCINVHFSLLPKYRGAAPVNWAIVNGEKESGVTTMKVVELLDAGPILLQQETPIGEKETAPELLERLAAIGADLLSDTLRTLNEIEPKPQIDSEASLARLLKREDGLIDWGMDAFSIERRIRGFQPWPNAYTVLNSRRLILWKASAERNESVAWAPGEAIAAQGNEFIVACGNSTKLIIRELQREGGRRLSAHEFLNGTHIPTGAIIGRV